MAVHSGSQRFPFGNTQGKMAVQGLAALAIAWRGDVSLPKHVLICCNIRAAFADGAYVEPVAMDLETANG